MIETDAVVVRVDGSHAWVRAQGQGHACGACAQKDGCHLASGGIVDAALGQPGKHLLCLPNTIHARPGDAIVIRARDGTILRAVWMAYGLPLLLALAGAAAGFELVGNEPAALIGMLSGLVAGIGMLRFMTRQDRQREPFLSIDFK